MTESCAFEEFEADLARALVRLYDANYSPAPTVASVMSLPLRGGVGPLQTAIFKAIDELRPEPGTPSGAVQERLHEILRLRFVLKLTQEETAEQLDMCVRHLRRAQREAVHLLARDLWDRSTGKAASEARDLGVAPGEGVQDWLAQLREELAALRESAPDAEADVAESLKRALPLARVLTAKQSVSLELAEPPQELRAAMQPSELKQVVLAAIRVLTQGVPGGRVQLEASRVDGSVVVTIAMTPPVGVGEAALSLIREILAGHSGAVELRQHTGSTCLVLHIPAAVGRQNRCRVLVVDDNKDLVRSFQLYAAGTRYDVVAPKELRDLPAAIEAVAPDAIVLDVMLPHTDGWELLVELRARAEMRSIPIIVCSVVPEQDLALALGAVAYLRKPVFRRQFVEALDAALSPGSAEA